MTWIPTATRRQRVEVRASQTGPKLPSLRALARHGLPRVNAGSAKQCRAWLSPNRIEPAAFHRQAEGFPPGPEGPGFDPRRNPMTSVAKAGIDAATHTQTNIDTVADASMTADTAQPWAELGLKADEYARIREILGRRPTTAELAMYSVMWSEHCSYKSSKVHLAQFSDNTTEAMNEKLLVGIGENAGVVDIGDGWAVTFKVESHNHPSYVEPYQGAATGVVDIGENAGVVDIGDGWAVTFKVESHNHPSYVEPYQGAA